MGHFASRTIPIAQPTVTFDVSSFKFFVCLQNEKEFYFQILMSIAILPDGDTNWNVLNKPHLTDSNGKLYFNYRINRRKILPLLQMVMGLCARAVVI